MMIKVQLFHHRNNDTMTDAKKAQTKGQREAAVLYRDASLLQDDGIPLQF